MLTPPPPPPASLPAPRRRPLRRLNRVLGIMVCGIILIIAAAAGYSIYQRGQGLPNRLLAQANPTGADNPFNGENSWIKPDRKYQPDKIPISTEILPTQKKEEPKPPPPEDDNGLEKARVQAWNDYWERVKDVRKDHFDNRKKAIADLKTEQPISSGGETKTAAAIPAAPLSTPVAAHGGSAPNFGSMWGGGNGGGGGFAGLPGFGGDYGGFGLGPTAQIDRESQEQKIAFAGQKGDLGKDDVVPTVRKPPDPLAVIAGSFVNFSTINTLISDVPGSTLGMVTNSVYNNDGSCVLIPQGSKLIGHYNSVVGAGQERLPGVLTRINFPDGSHQSIGAMEMADAAGAAGMEDEVNRHLAQKFTGAALSGLFGAGIYLAIPHNNNNFNNGYSTEQIIGASLAQQIGQTGQQITRQALSIPDTITIRSGANGVMITDRDIHIEPPYSCNGQRPSTLPIMSMSQ